jgi:hypothetical protein
MFIYQTDTLATCCQSAEAGAEWRSRDQRIQQMPHASREVQRGFYVISEQRVDDALVMCKYLVPQLIQSAQRRAIVRMIQSLRN